MKASHWLAALAILVSSGAQAEDFFARELRALNYHGVYQNTAKQAQIQISAPNQHGGFPFRFSAPNCQISGIAKAHGDHKAQYISRAPSGYKQFNTQTGSGEILYCFVNFEFGRSDVTLELDDCLACSPSKQKIELMR